LLAVLLDMVHTKFLLDLDAECLGAVGLPANSHDCCPTTLSGNVEASCSRVSEPACLATRPHATCSGCRTRPTHSAGRFSFQRRHRSIYFLPSSHKAERRLVDIKRIDLGLPLHFATLRRTVSPIPPSAPTMTAMANAKPSSREERGVGGSFAIGVFSEQSTWILRQHRPHRSPGEPHCAILANALTLIEMAF